jgi:hypothetical protein
VTEEADGSSSTVGVVTTGSPQHVKIDANAQASAEITDTYGPAPATLTVHKTINGPSAGKQGEITLSPKCGSATLPTWTIPAGTAAKTLTHTYQNIPGGSSCTVTETSDGATSTVLATVTGANQTVTVPAGTTATLSITDTYSPATGALKVTKNLAGPGAGRQGRVDILLVCSGSLRLFAFVIPAGHVGGPVTEYFDGIGGGSTCLVTEIVDGHTSTLTVTATGARQRVTVPAAGIASAHMTDTFSAHTAAASTSPSVSHTPLASTGPRAPITPLIYAALVAMLAGATLTILARRRRV